MNSGVTSSIASSSGGPLGDARSAAPFERIGIFDESTSCDRIGTQLRLIREEAPRVPASGSRRRGRPTTSRRSASSRFHTRPQFGLFRAHRTRSPFVTMTNRVTVVRFRDTRGDTKTLLFDPTDVELAENVPFYKALSARTPKILRSLGVKHFGNVASHLRAIGLDPSEIDYLAFDHLHTQDVRRLVGTRGPAADLSSQRSRASAVSEREAHRSSAELDLLREMHPIQSPWYQPETFRDLRPDSLLPITGDFLLGRGVALVSTPGHATGNQSLVLNTATRDLGDQRERHRRRAADAGALGDPGRARIRASDGQRDRC